MDWKVNELNFEWELVNFFLLMKVDENWLRKVVFMW